MANYTPNYQLHQWAPEDKFLRTDFNEDLNKIDTALDKLAQAEQLLEGKINECRLYTYTYTGTGSYNEANPCSLHFPIKPALVVIVGHFAAAIITAGSNHLIAISAGETISNNASWSEDGKVLTWYTYNSEDSQMNSAGWTYQVAVLGFVE